MKKVFEKLKKYVAEHRRILGIVVSTFLILLMLSAVFIVIFKNIDSDTEEESLAAETVTEETIDVRLSVVHNGTQSGQLINDESENDEVTEFSYKTPRAVGQAEVNAAIASRAAEKARIKAESVEESKKKESEEESSPEESENKTSSENESQKEESSPESESEEEETESSSAIEQ